MTNLKSLTIAQRIAHFRRLVAVAYADSKLADSELAVLQGVARRWEISTPEVNAALDTPHAGGGDWPEDKRILAHLLYDFVELSIIDGELLQSERKILATIESSLALGGGAVDQIKNAILEGNRMGRNEEDIRNEICSKLAG